MRQPHGRPGGGTDHVRIRKTNSMKLRVAVIYGGRSGEHEVSVRSAQCRSWTAWTPPSTRKSNISSTRRASGARTPSARTGRASRNRRGLSGAARDLRRGRHHSGSVRTGRPALCRRGRAGVLRFHGQGDDETCLCGTDVADCRLRHCHAGEARPGKDLRAPAVPHVCEARQPGSSVGISKVHDARELERRAQAAQYDRKVIVERGIIGRELECAVLGNDGPMASLPCEILPSREFYDYDDKSLLDRAETRLPADLPAEQTAELRRLAVECFRAVSNTFFFGYCSLLRSVTYTSPAGRCAWTAGMYRIGSGFAAGADGDRGAGYFPVQRHGGTQHRLRAARRVVRRDPKREPRWRTSSWNNCRRATRP